MASPAENKKVVERYYTEVLNEKLLDVLPDLLAEDVDGIRCGGADHSGPEGVRDYVSELVAGFPNLYAQLLSLLADGDTVAVHWVANPVNSGELFGMPATNKVVPLQFFDLFTLEDGRIKSLLSHPDSAAILTTLDVGFDSPVAHAMGFDGAGATAS